MKRVVALALLLLFCGVVPLSFAQAEKLKSLPTPGKAELSRILIESEGDYRHRLAPLLEELTLNGNTEYLMVFDRNLQAKNIFFIKEKRISEITPSEDELVSLLVKWARSGKEQIVLHTHPLVSYELLIQKARFKTLYGYQDGMFPVVKSWRDQCREVKSKNISAFYLPPSLQDIHELLRITRSVKEEVRTKHPPTIISVAGLVGIWELAVNFREEPGDEFFENYNELRLAAMQLYSDKAFRAYQSGDSTAIEQEATQRTSAVRELLSFLRKHGIRAEFTPY